MSAPSVSFAVQAHPSRSVAARSLADRIGGEVVWDPEPDGLRSPWRTFRRLMETTPADATHRLQIQDDAVVCPGFREAVVAAATARPDSLLVFYVGNLGRWHAAAVREACARDLPWARLDKGGWCPVVCTCWPVKMIGELLAWYDMKPRPRAWTADDEIVGRYLAHARRTALASVPSLVEHHDNGSSLTGRRGGRGFRRATCWVGDCGDCVASIDWTLGPTK